MQALSEYTLAIEVSNPGADAPASPDGPAAPRSGVALGRRDPDSPAIRCIGREWLNPRSRHDDALMPAIDALCRRASVAPRDLARIAVSIGPGGYTSLRIGVTIAKLIAEATGAACIPVPTAHAVLANLEPVLNQTSTCRMCLAWKRDSVWCQDFQRSARVWIPETEGVLVTLPQVTHRLPHALIAEPALVAMLPTPPAGKVIEPIFDPQGVLQASVNVHPVDPLRLAPLYPREPEAVTKWRELHPR